MSVGGKKQAFSLPEKQSENFLIVAGVWKRSHSMQEKETQVYAA